MAFLQQLIHAVKAIFEAVGSASGTPIIAAGPIETEVREVESFKAVSVTASIKLVLTQGEAKPLTVEAKQEVLPWIETVVRDGELRIAPKPGSNFTNRGAVTVYVTAPDIRGVSVSASSEVEGTNAIKGETFALSINSSGRGTLVLDVAELSTSLSSSGSANLSGTATRHTASVSSSARLKAEDLRVVTMLVQTSLSGSVDVSVSDELTGAASTSGQVRYYGEPRSLEVHTSTSGQVRKVG